MYENDILRTVESILRQHTPRLDASEIEKFVSDFLTRREIFLKICEVHGSPVYVIERAVLGERLKQFTGAFRRELSDIRVYYAVKSNNHPLMAGILVKLGAGLDVSSGLELKMGLETGAEDIVFSGPGKTQDELSLAVANSDRVTVLMDSFSELDRLQDIAERAGVLVRAGIRVNTKAHGIWRKFGIPLSDLSRFFDEAQSRSNIRTCGIQSHVSWNMNPDRQTEFINALGNTLAGLSVQHRSRIEFIDLGGGFWPSQGEWLQEAGTCEGALRNAIIPQHDQPLVHFKRPAVGIERFASAIGSAVREHIFPYVSCRICFEPGRWLCNDAMHLLMTVMDKKENDLLITDAGMNAVGWERFETDFFPVINLSRPDISEHKALVMGSLCTPHDVWGYGYFGSGIEPGNILLIPDQGAYTYSLRQNFIKPLPCVVCLGSETDNSAIVAVE
ncbi:MAG: alanine racemase [Lentisphaerae bacterium]|nr:alanine racemase [Lentisphaerota bacterium]